MIEAELSRSSLLRTPRVSCLSTRRNTDDLFVQPALDQTAKDQFNFSILDVESP